MKKTFSSIIVIAMLLCLRAFAWQDDVRVNLDNPFAQFPKTGGFGFLSGATAELRLGRYLTGDSFHAYRGGAEGDVALLNFGDSLLWHFALNVETLIDDKNVISFRLVHVYYQALTGIKWRLGSGVFHFGVRHRCGHGSDQAEVSRITIKLGPTAAYHWVYQRDSIRFDLEPGFNWYIVGQNKALSAHAVGGAFLAAQALWPLRGPVFMVVGLGTNLEVMGRSSSWVRSAFTSMSDLRVEPIFSGRLAIRMQNDHVKSDFALHFSQNHDSGIGPIAEKTTNLSFDVDFLW